MDGDFNFGFVVGMVGACLMIILFINFTTLTENSYLQTQEAVRKCKDGKWEKIDNTTIYCTDGAEYGFGE